MNQEKQRVEFAGPLLLALALLVVFILGLRTLSTAEVWNHLAAGRHLVQQGIASTDPFSFAVPANTAWRQTSWLYDFGIYAAWRVGGPALVIIAHAIAVAGAFVFLVPVCRRFSSFTAIAASIVLSAWILAPAFVPAPVTLCMFFAGLFIFLLERKNMTWFVMTILVGAQVLWANMHMSYVIGPLLALLAALESKFRGKTANAAPAPARLWALPLILLLSTLINPFGPGLWKELLAFVADRERQVVLEWISPFFREFAPIALSYLNAFALVVVAAVFILRREQLPLMLTCCAIICAYLLVRSSHHVHIAALLGLPFISLGFSTIGPFIGRTQKQVAGVAGQIILALVIAASIYAITSNRYYTRTGSASGFGLRVNTQIYPSAMMDILDRLRLNPGRMLNTAQDGGFLLCRRLDAHVYADTRGDFYGTAFFSRLAQALTGQNDSSGNNVPLPEVDTILLNGTWSGTRAATVHLLSSNEWFVAYFDGTSLLLAKNDEANRPFLENDELQKSGLAQIQTEFARYKRSLDRGYFKPANPARLIGAAAIYQSLGRYEDALPIYEQITRGSPNLSTAWLNRGIAELMLKKNREAVGSLTVATEKMPKQIIPWLMLAQACRNSGDEPGAARALDRARKINAAMTERFETQTLKDEAI